MSERELKSLKDLPVPVPRSEARRAALDVAMAAFDAAAPAGDTTAATEKSTTSTQGGNEPARPTHMISPKPRRNFMLRLSSSHYAIAASLAAAFVAVPAGLYVINQERSAHVPSGGGGLLGTFSPAPGAVNEPARQEADVRTQAQQLAKRDEAERKVAAKPPAMPAPVASAPAATAPAAAPAPATALAQAPASAPAMELASKDALRRGLAGPGFASGGSVATKIGDNSFMAPQGVAASRFRFTGQASVDPMPAPPYMEEGRDRFEHVEDNPVKQVASDPVSTFSIDVDTASYSFVRRALNAGNLPPADGVRVEELINYFQYDYRKPDSAERPFEPVVTVLPSLWNADKQLVHVAIKGYEINAAERPRANLVFLIDVSGSMNSPDKLPLVKNALKMLVENLKGDDTVGLVTYAGRSGVALEPTKISDKGKILAAIDALGAGGATAGAAGIEDAYRLIQRNFDKAAVNRVILATDGDFNVGLSDHNQLKSVIEEKRKSGVFLSVLGFGAGNYNDQLMQTLAQNGNGTAAYIDTLNEARKVLVEEVSSTLFPIAKDVKIQVEFNPAAVSEYRLVGYETRALRREDFNNDRIDAGDVGSGHTVTAIYEITPAGRKRFVDDLRYGKPAGDAAKPAAEPAADVKPGELGFFKLRYKLPNEDTSRLIELPIKTADALPSLDAASRDVRFGVAVASFGQMLKGGKWTGATSHDDVIALAQGAKGDDPFGLRAEFVNLVRLAKTANK